MAKGGDIITDFTRGQDHVNLSALDALLPVGSSLNFIGKSAFSHHAGDVHFTRESGGIALSVDINGDGVADAVLHLHGLSTLSASDLFL